MPPEPIPNALPPIAIVGAGGLGREVLLLLHQINQVQPTWQILGFYDDNPQLPEINGFPVLGTVATLASMKAPLALVLAIADPRIKARLCQELPPAGFYFPVLLHPGVANDSFQFNQIGEGTVINQACLLSTNIVVGRHVLLCPGCIIGHDAVLGDFCSLMPRVNLGGGSQLGEGVYLGTNATVLPQVTVGPNAIIGAGTVVTRHLPAHCTAVGVPANVIKYHEQ